MNYVKAHKDILLSGRKLSHAGKIYWKEDNKVFRHTVEDELSGADTKELVAMIAFDGSLKPVGNRVKALRQEAGLTVAELARITGIPKNTLLNFDQGQRSLAKATAETVYRLAKCFGVPMEYLIEDLVNKDHL